MTIITGQRVREGGVRLPGGFDAEGTQGFSLSVFERVLDDAIDTAAARTAAEAGPEFGQILLCAAGDDFDVALIGVADPAAQIKFAGFTLDEPAETNPLHPALDEEVKNHRRQPWSVLQIGASGRKGKA